MAWNRRSSQTCHFHIQAADDIFARDGPHTPPPAPFHHILHFLRRHWSAGTPGSCSDVPAHVISWAASAPVRLLQRLSQRAVANESLCGRRANKREREREREKERGRRGEGGGEEEGRERGRRGEREEGFPPTPIIILRRGPRTRDLSVEPALPSQLLTRWPHRNICILGLRSSVKLEINCVAGGCGGRSGWERVSTRHTLIDCAEDFGMR
ncbi:hypothetical protein JZ751_020052 [Albula glossodonta]|uniref:Uncharacterized protein n=1 Tax=Albula glossodonta TaxID=121402 RepID=A0A8T2NKU2_9TELE|nr:hypothetical protein JZ751_020052 [Albula glossodonta]